MIYGRDYDAPQKCSEGYHDCGNVDSCVRCEPGDWFCEKHLKTCEMCKRTLCPQHEKELQKTDMGMLCEDCREEFCAPPEPFTRADEEQMSAIADYYEADIAGFPPFGHHVPAEAESDMERARR